MKTATLKTPLVLALMISLALLLTVSSAGAAVLFTDDLRAQNPERVVKGGVRVNTPYGSGWKSTQPHKPMPGADGFAGSDLITYRLARNEVPGGKGMVEVLIVNDSVAADGPETILDFFSLKEQRSVFAIQVDWKGRNGTTLVLEGPEFKGEQFARKVALPTVATGGLLHLTIGWNDAGLVREVTANGVAVTVTTPLENVSRNAQRVRLVHRQKEGGLGNLLSQADSIRLGAMGYYDRFWPDGEQPSNETVILGFAVHDDNRDTPVLAAGTAGPSEIAAVTHDAARVAGFSGKLVAEDVMTVTIEGSAGAKASFDVARLAEFDGTIGLDWKGYGVYLEDKAFFDEGEIDLSEVDEYRVYVGTEPIGTITDTMEPVEVLEVGVQSYLLEGLDTDTPYYVKVVAVMGDGSLRPVIGPEAGIAMTENPDAPGTYEGTFTPSWGATYPKALIVGHLTSGDTTVTLADDEEFTVDTSLTVAMEASPTELKADESSTSEVTVTVTDANEDPVSGHEIRFLLATTSQYTGVVGGGAFVDEVGGTLDRDLTGETDLFGQVVMTYTAGFAAKTAIIVARDMVSNSTGAAYVKTYIQAAAELALEQTGRVAARAAGFDLKLTSSDDWLTADGESEARITAKVTQNGVPIEGHRVHFSVSSGTGRIRTVDGTTGSDGKARAVYTAGTKIGIVVIRAVDETIGLSASLQIELRSDAPAKIVITVNPEKLPADGRSSAEVVVTVTDINDNPNEGTEVEYVVAQGGGRLRSIENITNRDGESMAEYVAGRTPGKVSIEVTVRSTVPTEDEMSAARSLATAVTDYDFF